MEYHLVLAIISLVLVIISAVLMFISKRKFTEGYFRRYIDLIVISGTFMSIYLLASLVLKLGLEQLTTMKEIIKIISYVAAIVAGVMLIKSSVLLDKMSNKYSLKENKFFNKFKESQE